MNKSNIDEVKLGGARRKNGHKTTCTCHICENMKNKAKRGGYREEIEKKVEYISGGSKKPNGHRKDCNCPICQNMKNKKYKTTKTKKNMKKSGGESFLKKENQEEIDFDGGKKKSNGHKANCKCPICKNMVKRKEKKGGEEPDIENQLGNIEETKKTEIAEIKANEDDYDALDAAERGEHNPVGGRKTRRSRQSIKRRNISRRRR
jgi:hypothetical protein